jgi:hypothetical protein
VAVVGYFTVLLVVLKRVLMVLAVAVPSLLFLIVAGALGPAIGGFALVLALALSGLAWAFLPLIHAGPRSGMVFAASWLALATLHVVDSPKTTTGEVVVCWFIATLFLAVKLKAHPPRYFPPSWHNAPGGHSSADDA